MSAPLTIAHRVHGCAAPLPRTVVVVASQSGGNGSVREPAQPVTGRGHDPIAAMSAEHTAQAQPRRPRLADIADVVPGNGTPYGDALLPTDGGAVCTVLSVTSALAQRLTARVVRRFHLAGDVPPIYLPANVPGGDEHNHALVSPYAGCIRRVA